MQFRVTAQAFHFEDASGYEFDVEAVNDPERGWSAKVTIQAHGMVSADAATEALTPAVEQLLRQLKAHAKGAK